MKASLFLSLSAVVLFLTACETRVVDHHRGYRRTVYATVPGDRVIYHDSHYRRYDDDRVVYRSYGGTNRDYPRRSVDRTYAF